MKCLKITLGNAYWTGQFETGNASMVGLHLLTFYGGVHHTCCGRLFVYPIIPNTLEKVHGIEQEKQGTSSIARMEIHKRKLVRHCEERHCFSVNGVVVRNHEKTRNPACSRPRIILWIRTKRSTAFILQVGRTCTTSLYLDTMLLIIKASADFIAVASNSNNVTTFVIKKLLKVNFIN